MQETTLLRVRSAPQEPRSDAFFDAFVRRPLPVSAGKEL